MPEFVDIASHFDDSVAHDGYTGASLFMAQFTTFNETSVEGGVVRRRVMSCHPEILMPPRRVIETEGERWIVGDGNVDMFDNTAVRRAYWMRKATHVATIMSPGDLLKAVEFTNGIWALTGEPIYVNLEFNRDTVDAPADAGYTPQWDIYSAPAEPAGRGRYLYIDGTIYRVRQAHVELNGLQLSTSDQLDANAIVMVTVNTGVWNPVTETMDGAVVDAPGILVDLYLVYSYSTQQAYKMEPGDKALVFDTKLAVGTTLKFDDLEWRVMSVSREVDSYLHHIRRA